MPSGVPSSGLDPALLGRTIQVDGRPALPVLGIMPASFDPTTSAEALWVPLAFTPARRAMHDEHYLNVYATPLKPGVTMAQATADMNRVAADSRGAVIHSTTAAMGRTCSR